MKYETLSKMQEYYYQNTWWVYSDSQYSTQKEEYTLGDFLRFLPLYIFGNSLELLGKSIEYLWNHRKIWVIAKASNHKQETEESK
jgi:hypothetical protein